MKASERFLAFVDIETTGLDPVGGYVLEVGCVIANRDFDIVDDFSDIIRPHAPRKNDGEIQDWAEVMDDFVRNMHDRSGLIKDIKQRNLGVTLRQAEIGLLDFLHSWFGPDDKNIPLCGSSPQFDRNWLVVHMPDFEAAFHYRNIDVSTVKELCRRLCPDVYRKMPDNRKPAAMHRVIPDLHDTVAEMKFYADNFLFLGWEDDEAGVPA